MRSSSFLFLFALVVGLQGCFFGDDDSVHRSPSGGSSSSGTSSAPSGPCNEQRPLIFALDMQPSATVSAAGDYEITGTIRTSCSAVTVQAHVDQPDGDFRWAVSPGATPDTKLSLRFAASQKGEVVEYEVSAFDALGNESYPRLRQSVTLE